MDFVTISDAVSKNKLSSSIIRRACQRGYIRGAVKLGKTWVFSIDSFESWRAATKRGRPHNNESEEEV